VRVSHDQIVVEGAGKEDGFLRHHPEGCPEFVGGQVADILAVQFDLPFLRFRGRTKLTISFYRNNIP
jgi:hypothetical protein